MEGFLKRKLITIINVFVSIEGGLHHNIRRVNQSIIGRSAASDSALLRLERFAVSARPRKKSSLRLLPLPLTSAVNLPTLLFNNSCGSPYSTSFPLSGKATLSLSMIVLRRCAMVASCIR